MTTATRVSLGPAHTRCTYAACSRTAAALRDGWALCGPHAVLHDEEKVDGTRTRDAGGRVIRTGPPTRELVAQLHALGLSDTVIAERLGIARRTVREHRARLGLAAHVARASVAACGTRSGRMRHRDLGEPACEACVEADRAWHRNRYRKAVA